VFSFLNVIILQITICFNFKKFFRKNLPLSLPVDKSPKKVYCYDTGGLTTRPDIRYAWAEGPCRHPQGAVRGKLGPKAHAGTPPRPFVTRIPQDDGSDGKAWLY